ncbi:MAG: DNA polymerase III subunit beta [Oscillospiraceae bacterium]|nr:DNA polymerase III subunit beta [Oscillospiraceae bacterium]
MMKFTCQKNLLVSAISMASRTVAAKSPFAVLEGLYLRAGRILELTGYNLETGITVSVPAEIAEQGECVLPTRLFFDMIRKLPEDEVTVSVDEKYKVSIRAGIVSFTLSAESGEEYPDLPEVKEEDGIEIPQNVLKEMIAGTIFSASENATRPIHTGCLFEVEEDCVTVVAVDGFRLAVRRWHPEKKLPQTMKFVVPAAALREVMNLLSDDEENAEFILGRRHIVFCTNEARLVCRILEGEFMDWRKVLMTGESTKLVARVSALAASLDRVSLVVNEKFKSPVRCVFGNQNVDFKTSTVMGTAHDNCSLSGDGKDLEIGFNCRYFLDAVKAVPDSEVTLELTNGLSPMVLTPVDGRDEYTYLVLPVRMRSEG